MKRKQKQQLSSLIPLGASGALCLALLGFTIPKMGALEDLKREWERIEPLAFRGAVLAGSDDPSVRFGEEPQLQLPSGDGGIEFGKLVTLCGEAARIAFDSYRLAEASGWPPKAPDEASKALPESYTDFKWSSDPGAVVRRRQIELGFSCDFPSLLDFCRRLQEIPRLAQVCSLEVKGSDGKLQVGMRVEAYNLSVPR